MQPRPSHRALIARSLLAVPSRMLSLVALACVCLPGTAEAANIYWGSVAGAADQDFITLLEGAGHTVTRFTVAGAPSAAQIAELNAADLVIIGRAVNSGDFDNANARPWNTQITNKLIAMSAYTTRRNRMGWSSGDTVPDSGPTALNAVNPSHPVFDGITFVEGTQQMANDYNFMIDRGTTMMGNSPTGGTVIATSATTPTNIAIAEWAAGATVTDESTTGANMVLSAPRWFFAGGSREANGAAVATAGQMDLTEDGQQLFLNLVDYALTVPEPSTAIVLVGACGLLLRRRVRQ